MAATALALNAGAQKIRLKEGSLEALKDVKKLNLRFRYDSMTVTTKDIPEEEFLKTKTEEYNDKESGKGTAWARSWNSDRAARFEPRFKESFEDVTGIKIGKFSDAAYTLVFKTTHTETGYNIGISRRNAYIDGEVWIVETANPSHVIAMMTVDNAPGRIYGGFDFDTGTRLQECYAMAGKNVGKFINKKL